MATTNFAATPAVLTDENSAFLRQYIQTQSGIALGPDKEYLLRSRLQPILQKEAMASLNDLCARLRGNPVALRKQIVEAMTTHETLFFRDITVFDMLRDHVLPQLLKQRAGLKRLRIWSAACSSGQEAYSLAMLLIELGCSGWDIEILGTDISTPIVERATEGRFMQIEVNRGLPAGMLVKYFSKVGRDWQVSDQLRRMTRFSCFDLRGDMRTLGRFDLVLCRNVLIYFETDTQMQILAGARSVLAQDGYLVLGSSETAYNLGDHFQRVTYERAMAYQPR